MVEYHGLAPSNFAMESEACSTEQGLCNSVLYSLQYILFYTEKRGLESPLQIQGFGVYSMNKTGSRQDY